jgi:uncharacterized membrane protein (UPF0127 family)
LGFDERREQRMLAWAIVVVFVLGLLSFIAKGADQPADPYLKPAAASGSVPSITVPGVTVPARVQVPGYGEIAFRVTAGPKLCALLAQTAAQQARGLMQRSDLAGHAAMLFVFAADTKDSFYMRNTPIPLSIAWFDSAGRWVSQTDMAPCADKPNCPTYAAARAYRYAVEVPQGGLSGLGVGPGSTISVGGGC